MEQMDERDFIHMAFQKCMERGWLNKLTPSVISPQDIMKLEQRYRLNFPLFYKEFLTTYQLPEDMLQICGIAEHADEPSPLWLILHGTSSVEQLSQHIKFFREDAEEFRGGTAIGCGYLIPIGDWGAGWGPLCIDTTKPDELVHEDDESTWSLVWFDHEEFDWGNERLAQNGLLHGSPAAPNLKTLLAWYFCGSLETEFEEEHQVKLSYERLNNEEFCRSYWEDKWKI